MCTCVIDLEGGITSCMPAHIITHPSVGPHTYSCTHAHTQHSHPTQTVAANMSGELHLRMEAEDVTATTYFKDLQNHQFGRSIFVVLVAML